MEGKHVPPPDRKLNKSNNVGRKPGRTITVSRDLGRSFHVFEVQKVTDAWKVEFECDVEPRFDHGRLIRFEIFGPGANLEKTVRVVNKWIDRSVTKTAASTAWAKTPAWENRKWTEDQLRVEERERKLIFKGPAPEGLTDKVEVAWPEELMGTDTITPRDVFGGKLEHLDSIRMDCEVFISLLPNRAGLPHSQVEICGHSMNDVLAGEQAYLNAIQKVMAQKFLGHTSLNIILDETEGRDVMLEQIEDWWPAKRFKIVPHLLPTPMTDDPGTFRKEGLHYDQRKTLQHEIQRSIEAIRFEKGSYDFAIRYGSVALTNPPIGPEVIKIGERYPVMSFLKGINTNIGCHVMRWLAACDLGHQLLARLMMADHILEPAKTLGGSLGINTSTLTETRPTFRGTWVFHDPNQRSENQRPPARHTGRSTPSASKSAATIAPSLPPRRNLIVVQVDWTEDEDGMYEKMPPMFYSLKPGNSGPSERMNINLLELGDSKGWHFGLESMIVAPRSTMSPIIVGFADRVKLKAECAKNPNSDQVFAHWSLGPSQIIEFARLDKMYTFGIKRTGYQVECTAMWYPQQKEPCWGLNVRHRDWPSHLCELERLAPGRGVDFGDVIETFIPENGVASADDEYKDIDVSQLQALNLSDHSNAPVRDGIRILVGKLLQLSDLINESRDST